MGCIQSCKKMIAIASMPVLGVGFLRLLLALSVVFTHSANVPFFGFVYSTIAVQSFFVVSGFYMALILTEKYKRYFSFILNRFLRIFPLYYAILFITIIVYFHGNIFSFVKNWFVISPAAAFLVILTNVFIFGQDFLNFIAVNSGGALYFVKDFNNAKHLLSAGLLIPQGWTLSLELMFYLIAPFVVKVKNKTILFLISLGLLLRLALYFGLKGSMHGQWTYFFFPAELVFFFIGIASYRMYKFLKDKNININRRFLAIFATVFFMYNVFYSLIPANMQLKKGAYFLMLIFGLPLLFLFSKNSKFDRYIADLSYPIYLSHFLIIEILTSTVVIPKYLFGAVVAVLSIMVSVILYQFVIKPFDGLRQRKLQTAADLK